MIKVLNDFTEDTHHQQESDEYLQEKRKLIGQERTTDFNLGTD